MEERFVSRPSLGKIQILERSIFVADAAWKKGRDSLLRFVLASFREDVYRRERFRIIGDIEFSSNEPVKEGRRFPKREVRLWARGYKLSKRSTLR
jgi:hypothetical protein